MSQLVRQEAFHKVPGIAIVFSLQVALVVGDGKGSRNLLQAPSENGEDKSSLAPCHSAERIFTSSKSIEDSILA